MNSTVTTGLLIFGPICVFCFAYAYFQYRRRAKIHAKYAEIGSNPHLSLLPVVTSWTLTGFFLFSLVANTIAMWGPDSTMVLFQSRERIPQVAQVYDVFRRPVAEMWTIDGQTEESGHYVAFTSEAREGYVVVIITRVDVNTFTSNLISHDDPNIFIVEESSSLDFPLMFPFNIQEYPHILLTDAMWERLVEFKGDLKMLVSEYKMTFTQTADTTSAISAESDSRQALIAVHVRWLKLAEDGDIKSMFDVGVQFRFGVVVEQDYVKAMHWLRKSADGGHPKAMYWVATMYGEGKGVERDTEEELRWLHKSADGEFADAMLLLGAFYYDGDAVKQDYAMAMRWFKKGANAGNPDAMDWVGKLYSAGLGVKRDEAEAERWFAKAKAAGFKEE